MNSPHPFLEALRRLKRAALPTVLSSAELAMVDAQVLERGFFSARNTFEAALEQTRDLVAQIASPQQITRPDRVTPQNPAGLVTVGENLQTARVKLKELYQRLGYRPSEEDAGTIKDLSSDARIKLTVTHNEQEAAGYGQYLQGQSETVLEAFPCQELIRAEQREEPRDWVDAWRSAGGRTFPGGNEPTFQYLRLIARKDDPIWVRISRFGHPWPPFDFNSGVELADVDRNTAIEFGIITPDDVIQPGRMAFNDSLAGEPQ